MAKYETYVLEIPAPHGRMTSQAGLEKLATYWDEGWEHFHIVDTPRATGTGLSREVWLRRRIGGDVPKGELGYRQPPKSFVSNTARVDKDDDLDEDLDIDLDSLEEDMIEDDEEEQEAERKRRDEANRLASSERMKAYHARKRAEKTAQKKVL